jgi:hypothetical protein
MCTPAPLSLSFWTDPNEASQTVCIPLYTRGAPPAGFLEQAVRYPAMRLVLANSLRVALSGEAGLGVCKHAARRDLVKWSCAGSMDQSYLVL